MNDQELVEGVRTGLHVLAGPPVGAEESASAVAAALAGAGRRTGHRRGLRRTGRAAVWLAAAAVVALLAAGGALRAVLPSPAGTASPAARSGAPAPISAWPARGTLVHDQALITQAVQVWHTGAPADRQPGRDATVLYAGTVQGGHAGEHTTVVMLRSRSGGATLVGVVSSLENLSGSVRPAGGLVLRAVAEVGPNTTIRSVGFVGAATPADHPGEMAGSLGFVLLAPGITTGQVQSSIVDSIMSDTSALPPAPDGLVTFQGFPGSAPWNSWVATPEGTPGVDVLAGGVDAPTYTAGTVSSKGIVTSGDGTPVRVGDLVVARDEQPAGDGLLGVVTSVTGGAGAPGRTGTVDTSLKDLKRWGLQAVSYGSGYRGTLSRSAKGGLVFTTEKPDAPNGVSRVVVQTADGSVTVNVGGFAGDPGAGNTTSPFPLAQTDTLPASGTRPVWIVATGH